MQITLTVTEGPHKGQSFMFDGHDTFLVGRSQRAHFRLPAKDQYFSRIHFMIELNPPHCRLLDMGSRNGTHVNGEMAAQADLKDGDKIRAGQTTIAVSISAASEALANGDPPAPAPVVAEEAEQAVFDPHDTWVKQARATLGGAEDVPPARCTLCGAPVDVAQSLTLCPSCMAISQRQGQPIPGYQVVRELGRGGTGVVYLACRTADQQMMAVKVITPAVSGSLAQIERFLREAQILRQLEHPHIVPFREMGEANGRVFFAMDYVEGADAARLLKSEGPFAIPRAVRLITQVLHALEYAHGRGFVHRDIKPANMLVSQRDGKETVQLADFGLARVYQATTLSGLTMLGDIGGTAAFMAPEQITNFRETRPAADQYAVAASLYNLLTGCYIFDLPRNMSQQLLLILQGQPVPIQQRRAEVPTGLARVLERALAREPGDRFPDVAALRAALAEFAAGDWPR